MNHNKCNHPIAILDNNNNRIYNNSLFPFLLTTLLYLVNIKKK